MFKEIQGHVCAPQGFLASGVHAAIRKNTSKPDVALIFSKVVARAAGVFTLNLAKAAPLLVTQENIKNGQLQAIVVNSGNANACTGELGLTHAKVMRDTVAQELNINSNLVCVSSTGVIGVTLPIHKVTSGIKEAKNQLSQDGSNAALAIMTTDTFSKSVAVEFCLNNKIVRIGGIAKGSGMIHPNMATMLGFMTTDVFISQACLQEALSKVNEASFNMITVDGESSTNDMVVVLANGLAQNTEITSLDSPEGKLFFEAFEFVSTSLAKQIVRDGEGATKLIEVHIRGAQSLHDARIAAKSVCASSLVKTAIFGSDANWGRIVSAIGASGASINLNLMNVDIGNISLLKQGTPVVFDEDIAKAELDQKTISICVDLGTQGNYSATGWGCDLTYDYIKINAAYRT